MQKRWWSQPWKRHQMWKYRSVLVAKENWALNTHINPYILNSVLAGLGTAYRLISLQLTSTKLLERHGPTPTGTALYFWDRVRAWLTLESAFLYGFFIYINISIYLFAPIPLALLSCRCPWVSGDCVMHTNWNSGRRPGKDTRDRPIAVLLEAVNAVYSHIL